MSVFHISKNFIVFSQASKLCGDTEDNLWEPLHCWYGMEPVLFSACTQENLMALATSLSTAVSLSKGESWTALEWLAWRWNSRKHFSIPISPIKGKEGKPDHPVWSYWTCYHWLPGISTACLSFQKDDSNVVKDALLCGVRCYDFSIMLLIPFFFLFLFFPTIFVMYVFWYDAAFFCAEVEYLIYATSNRLDFEVLRWCS